MWLSTFPSFFPHIFLGSLLFKLFFIACIFLFYYGFFFCCCFRYLRLKHYINHWQRMWTYLWTSEPGGDNCIAWQTWTAITRTTVVTWHCLQMLRRSLAFIQNYMLQYIFTSFWVKHWLELSGHNGVCITMAAFTIGQW